MQIHIYTGKNNVYSLPIIVVRYESLKCNIFLSKKYNLFD